MMFIFIMPRFSISITDFGRAGLVGVSTLMGQPAILSCAKSWHAGGQGSHGFWLFLAEASREPFVTDAVLERGHGFSIWTIDDLIFLCQEMVQNF
jgi:hypothetical protein